MHTGGKGVGGRYNSKNENLKITVWTVSHYLLSTSITPYSKFSKISRTPLPEPLTAVARTFFKTAKVPILIIKIELLLLATKDLFQSTFSSE
jgi:hypothetical protein